MGSSAFKTFNPYIRTKMDEELKEAIDKLNSLFRERNSAESWADNIIAASKNLTKKKNWTKFYAYMASPTTFDPDREYKTIEECNEIPDLKYPDGLEAVEYKNGTETFIHVRRVVEDEKEEEKSAA